MTEAMPFLQKYDITFLRPPALPRAFFLYWQPKTTSGLAGGFDLSLNAPCFCIALDSIHRGARPACVALA